MMDPGTVTTLGIVVLGSCAYLRKISVRRVRERSRKDRSSQQQKGADTDTTSEDAVRREKEVEEVRRSKEVFDLNGDVELAQFRYAWTEQALLRFSKTIVSFKETNLNYPRTTATGAFPYLRVGTHLLTGSRIREYLVRVSKMDDGLSLAQQSQSDALCAVVSDVETLFIQLRWSDDAIRTKKTIPEVGGRVPWFVRWFVLRAHRLDMKARIGCAKEPHLSHEQIRERILRNFRVLDQHLSEDVGGGSASFGGSYFFGDRPRYVDAACFGVVAVALEENLGLRNLVQKECLYLVEFYERVRKEFFDGWPKTTNELVGDGLYRPAISSSFRRPAAHTKGSEFDDAAIFFESDITHDLEKAELNDISFLWLNVALCVISTSVLSRFISPQKALAVGFTSSTLMAACAPYVISK